MPPESTAQLDKDCSDGEVIKERDETLAIVRRLLEEREVSVSFTRCEGLRLNGSGSNSLPQSKRVELVVYSPGGWEVAAVSVGGRSRFYMISLPRSRSAANRSTATSR